MNVISQYKLAINKQTHLYGSIWQQDIRRPNSRYVRNHSYQTFPPPPETAQRPHSSVLWTTSPSIGLSILLEMQCARENETWYLRGRRLGPEFPRPEFFFEESNWQMWQKSNKCSWRCEHITLGNILVLGRVPFQHPKHLWNSFSGSKIFIIQAWIFLRKAARMIFHVKPGGMTLTTVVRWIQKVPATCKGPFPILPKKHPLMRIHNH